MGLSALVRNGQSFIFAILVIFSVIEVRFHPHQTPYSLSSTSPIQQLSISAWLVSQYSTHHNYTSLTNRDRVRFALFASAWTVSGSMLFIVLLIHYPNGSILTGISSHLV
jgi:hypothetical protein